jgi:hypothetical protein
MSEPSPERLSAAIQALFQARPVEGPPGDDGQRSVWHLSPGGAELLSFVDREGRVQRQELTLLEEHCVWTSGVGLRTGRVEHEGLAARTTTATVHPDAQPVPARLLRAALALEGYRGEDRYLLHIQRVLALARQGLVLSGSASSAPPATPAAPRPAAPAAAPASTGRAAPSVPPGADPFTVAPQVPPPDASRTSEGLIMLGVLGLGLLVGLLLLSWLL